MSHNQVSEMTTIGVTMSDNKASKMTTEPTNAIRTNILSLNFYCLDAIFSSKCLLIEDLCSIAGTHYHIKEVVDRLFAKRHKNYEVTLRRNNTEFERENTKRIFSNFGDFISVLSIDACGVHEEIIAQCMDWVMEYCGDTLESLKLSWLKITEDRSIKLKPLFDRLQKISLERCDVRSDTTLFNNCKSLVELKLVGVAFDDRHSTLENTFAKLVRFEYWHGETDSIADSIWNDFFSRHKNLKAIHLTRIQDGTADLLSMVADNCKQLAELDIYIGIHENEEKFRNALSSILTLESLNKLRIRCVGRNITKFIEGIATLKSLKFLTVCWAEADSEFVAALSKLTRLQSLKLSYCEGLASLNPLGELEGLTELKIRSYEDLTFDLVPMIRRLIRLKTLDLCDRSFQMNKRMYQRIVDVLRERPGSFQNTLQMRCLRAKDFVVDRQFEKILAITDLEKKYYL